MANCTAASPWSLSATLALSFVKETVDVAAIAKLLPLGVAPVIVPSSTKVWTNATNVQIYANHYDASPAGAYSSLVIAAQGHHAPTNTTGWCPLFVYTDSADAAACGAAQWGLPTQPVAHFAWSAGRSVLGGARYDELSVKTSSSVLAKGIASLTNYYNASLSPEPGPANGTCDSAFDARNCTLRLEHIYAKGRALLTWELETTGPVMPSLGKFEPGSGADAGWADLHLGNTAGFVPSQLSRRQAGARGVRTAPAVVCSDCLPGAPPRLVVPGVEALEEAWR